MTNVLKSVATLKVGVKLVRIAVLYNLMVFFTFYAMYSAIDFAKHFESKDHVTVPGKLYFTMMMHASVGSNDITPRTDFARTVVSLHVLCSWLQLLMVFLG